MKSICPMAVTLKQSVPREIFIIIQRTERNVDWDIYSTPLPSEGEVKVETAQMGMVWGGGLGSGTDKYKGKQN